MTDTKVLVAYLVFGGISDEDKHLKGEQELMKILVPAITAVVKDNYVVHVVGSCGVDLTVLPETDKIIKAEAVYRVANIYDTNELPSKSANLLPEYTNPAWMLEQGWTMDSCIDEKSKATIEKMLQEEQHYLNGKGMARQRHGRSISMREANKIRPLSHKQPWNEEEKNLFLKGMEMFGRSWSKIGQLIPTRTTLQVKNYAQQFFKQQAKKSSQDEKSIATSSPSSSVPPQHSDPITHVLVSVTTGQTTISNISPTQQPGLKLNEQVKVSKLAYGNVGAKDKGKKNDMVHVTKRLGSTPTKSSTVTRIDTDFWSPPKHRTPTKVSQGPSLIIENTLDVLPKVKQSQLSPTLEDKLASSTGIIENLDKFCAVADIITSGSTDHEDEEIDIDIENDDDNDENQVLKSRSASPNSVYEHLLKAANMKNKEISQRSVDNSNKNSPGAKVSGDQVLSKENVAAISASCATLLDKTERSKYYHHEGSQDNRPFDMVDNTSVSSEVVSESSEEWSTESSMSTDSSHHTEKRISNTIVLSNGEVVEFPLPTQVCVLKPDVISDEERKIHLEFFDGRPSKTPERYLKIRNYIMDSWGKCKPNYLNKTSVRPGLKNCGDVNCIGRIHAYLECTGAINFGCEQVCYKQPAKVSVQGPRERFSKETISQQINFSKLEAMRPRKRRIRDSYGQWVDEKELQGKTIEHKEGYDDPSKPKAIRFRKSGYDPFKLIPCVPFSEENLPPFSVEIFNAALVTMDMHAHISKTEVIGMLGGQYIHDKEKLIIALAVPCNSISTGLQCEMDPVSQTQASEEISDNNLSVVGWYHSHPTFSPHPSIRDIETQLKFQEWFSKGGSKFVGMIVSPYNRQNTSLCSEFQCLTIGDKQHEEYMCNIPHSFNYDMVIHAMLKDDIIQMARNLAEKYAVYSSRVELLRNYRISSQMLCLDKMLESIRDLLDLSDVDVEDVIKSLRGVFVEIFTSKKPDIINPDISDGEEEVEYSLFVDTPCIPDDVVDVKTDQSESGSHNTKLLQSSQMLQDDDVMNISQFTECTDDQSSSSFQNGDVNIKLNSSVIVQEIGNSHEISLTLTTDKSGCENNAGMSCVR